MASQDSPTRKIVVTAGIGIAALLAAAASALPAAADPHGETGDGTSASHGNSANAPGHNKSGDGSSTSQGHQSANSSSDQSTGHNPPGNNGTVFIHDVANDQHPHNVPHVSCTFYVDFFNFDNAQTVTVSFAGQAPTGKGTALGGGQTTTLQADDASGAGNDWDGELAFTADQLGVSTLGAAAHQGYHVKMTVVTNEPGDHKYKVFWIEPCANATTTQPTTVGGVATATGQTTGQSTSPAQTSASSGSQPAATTSGQSTGGALAPLSGSQSNTGIPTEVLGTKFTRGGASPAAAATSSSLPFTGAEIGAMALAAAAALGGGVLLTVAGRRRRRISSN